MESKKTCTLLDYDFYADKELNKEAILPHVLYSEKGIPIQRLMCLVEKPDSLYVRVRWRGVPPFEDTDEPLRNVFEDAPTLVRKLLARKNTPANLSRKARSALSLSREKGV